MSSTNRGVILEVHVQPGAGRTGLVGVHGEALKLAVRARPADGAANREVTSLIADLLGLPPRAVTIISGSRSRRKQVLIGGVTESEVGNRLLEALPG